MMKQLFALLILAGALGVASPSFARDDTPASFAGLAERLMPAVVNISTSQTVQAGGTQGEPPLNDLFEEFFRRPPNGQRGQRKASSLGSGFVIDPSGIIVTNNHVIEEADEIVVNFPDGSKYAARVLGRDPKTDLAVLKIDADGKLPFVKLGDSTKSRVGDWVVAIGNPFGLGGSLSVGVISAINRDINSGPYDSFIQTDAAINRGNSGGPLFNLEGEVIGVNSAIISPSGASVGIGFAIPSDLATHVVAQLREYGETRRGWLGVRIQLVTAELAENLGLDSARGALVSEVTPDGPAESAGLRPGDVIVRFDGKEVVQMRDLPRIVAETPIEKAVKVDVVRQGKSKRFSVVTGRLEETLARDERPVPPPDTRGDGTEILGLTLSDLDKRLRNAFLIDEKVVGALVLKITPGVSAFEDGVRRGDVITRIGDTDIADAAAAIAALNTARESGKKSVLVLLSSRGALRFIALRVQE